MTDVILLKDVDKLGAEGAVVQVKPGYARNYLIPSGLAAPATPQQMQAIEAAKQQRAKQAQRATEEAEAVKRQLEGRSLTLKLTLGEDEKPFGSVTAHDVAEALGREGITVEKSAIQLEHPLKALGIYDIPVRIRSDVTATVKLWIVKA